jgi:hypothetical protein
MRQHKVNGLKNFFLSTIFCRYFEIRNLLLVLLFLLPGLPAPAANKLSLHDRYAEIKPKLAANRMGLPVWIESTEQSHFLQGDVYGLFAHSFASVRERLKEPAAWCDISFLHFNTKTCLYAKEQNQVHLITYSGRKFYEPPERAYFLDYQFKVVEDQADFLQVTLTAAKGPLSTKDYQVSITAIPVEENKTFLHFRYAYRYGTMAEWALSVYLGTGGSNKIGFSVVADDPVGNPVFVKGLRGLVERNAVRYYLAVQAYLDTLSVPEPERLSQRLSLWFDLTDQFKAQLFEMDKKEYIQNKLREYNNQTVLQTKVNHPKFKYGMPILLNSGDKNGRH